MPTKKLSVQLKLLRPWRSPWRTWRSECQVRSLFCARSRVASARLTRDFDGQGHALVFPNRGLA